VGTLRRGEVLGLRRVDVELGAVTVRVGNGAVIIDPPKSGARMWVHMPPNTMEVFALEALSRSVREGPNRPPMTADTVEITLVHACSARDGRQTRKGRFADQARPSGFEPEARGIDRPPGEIQQASSISPPDGPIIAGSSFRTHS
jgi:hypothetical protein